MAATCRLMVPVGARVGAVRFPSIQINLRLFEALEALPVERSLAFAIRVP
jgi:hypothetical protein